MLRGTAYIPESVVLWEAEESISVYNGADPRMKVIGLLLGESSNQHVSC